MTIKRKYKRSRSLHLGYIPYGFDSGSGAAIKIDPDPTDQWYHQDTSNRHTSFALREKVRMYILSWYFATWIWILNNGEVTQRK